MGEVADGLEEQVRPQGRSQFKHHREVVVTGVGEAVRDARLGDDRLAGPREDLLRPDAEPSLTGVDLPALFLVGMHVGHVDRPARCDHQFGAEQLTVRLGAGGEEREALLLHGVLEGLPCLCHAQPSFAFTIR